MWKVEQTDEVKKWWEGLAGSEQDDIVATVNLLKEDGPHLRFPFSSDIRGSRNGHLRELRVRSGRKQIRIFYAFDPRRVAILLIGGYRTIPNFFKRYVRKADRLYDEYLATLRNEGLIP